MHMNFSEQLKILRKKKGITSTALAKLAGISQSTVAQIERGRNEPSFQVLQKICDVLGISIEEFTSKEQKGTAWTLKDRELLYYFKQIEKLNKEDQDTVKSLLKAYLKKKSVK